MSGRTERLVCPGSLRLLAQVAPLELGRWWRRGKRRLGVGRPAAVGREALPVVDSVVGRRAEEVLRETSPPWLVHHGFRAWAFGWVLGQRLGWRFDAERLYVAALLHDLGFTEAYSEPAAEPFELRGARGAYALCRECGWDEASAVWVHEAIALHTSVGGGGPSGELGLVQLGSGLDVIGLRVEDVSRETIAWVVEEWPRLGFKAALLETLEGELARSPGSPLVGQMRLGFGERIRRAPFRE